MEINGKYLAWAIIHLVLFIYMGFTNFGIVGLVEGIIILILIIYFAWRFIVNMEKAFFKRGRLA